jgi:hypothetical protein
MKQHKLHIHFIYHFNPQISKINIFKKKSMISNTLHFRSHMTAITSNVYPFLARVRKFLIYLGDFSLNIVLQFLYPIKIVGINSVSQISPEDLNGVNVVAMVF